MATADREYIRRLARRVGRSSCFVRDRLREAPPEIQADVEDRDGLRVLGPKAIEYVVSESDLRPRRRSHQKTARTA